MNRNIKVISAFLLTVIIIFLYAESEYKKRLFYDEKIYDFKLQYSDKISSYRSIMDILSRKIVENRAVLISLNASLEDKERTDIYKDQLFEMISKDLEDLKRDGVDYINFHLADGRSILRVTRPDISGENFNSKSIKAVHLNKKVESHYEIDRFFEGIRYIYPLFLEDKFLGSVELSIDMESLIASMYKGLDAAYSMIVKADAIKLVMDDLYLKNHYHETCLGSDYYMHTNIHNSKVINKSIAKSIYPELKSNLPKDRAFAINRVTSLLESEIYLFLPTVDKSGENMGYMVSKRIEGTVNEIYIEQCLKLLSVLIVFYIFTLLYKKNLKSIALLDQYKNVVDQTTLLSKTDLSGKITYVNSAFEKLSGYSNEELLGKAHSIVRHDDMPSESFENLWKTIKAGNVWHGKVKNRKKDGGSYTVDATIFPIKNDNGVTVEYIAIRYDITEFEELKELLTKELSSSNQSLKDKMNLLLQYEKTIESAASFTRTDLKGVITYLNETHEKITGYKKEELIGHRHTPFLRDYSVPRGFYRELWETIKSKKSFKGVITNIAKDGKTIYLDTLVVPILDSDENIVEYMSIQYDISDMVNMHKEIEDTQREVIYKMGEIGESRSKETGNHVKRVAEYSKLLAIKYGLDAKEAELLYDASPMHDIGKVGIPDSVLKKPGKLDEGEWKIMRTHSEIGYSVLKGSNREILKAAATVAYEHHEKFDGSGYPKGIKGEEIHIYGRITAIADVFDALGSDRVYKKAWDDEKIFELFKRERGNHFDPKLVDIFFKNLEQFLEIREKFRD